MLKKKDVLVLEPYKKHFNTAHSGYIRGLYSKDINIIKSVYELYGNKLTNSRCSTCILNMCKWCYNEINKYNERYGRKPNNGQQESSTYDETPNNMRPVDSGNIESEYSQEAE